MLCFLLVAMPLRSIYLKKAVFTMALAAMAFVVFVAHMGLRGNYSHIIASTPKDVIQQTSTLNSDYEKQPLYYTIIYNNLYYNIFYHQKHILELARIHFINLKKRETKVINHVQNMAKTNKLYQCTVLNSSCSPTRADLCGPATLLLKGGKRGICTQISSHFEALN